MRVLSHNKTGTMASALLAVLGRAWEGGQRGFVPKPRGTHRAETDLCPAANTEHGSTHGTRELLCEFTFIYQGMGHSLEGGTQLGGARETPPKTSQAVGAATIAIQWAGKS